jgi:hypothetical protein
MFASHTSASELGDPLHEIAREDSLGLVPVVNFDFASLDPAQPEDMVSVAEASSASSKILAWIVGDRNSTDDLRNVGGRAGALQVLLDSNGRYKSLAAVARDANVSRSIVSQWLLRLRDSYNLRLSLRGSEIRRNCQEAQFAAVAAGTHSSRFTRKNSIRWIKP